MDNINLNPHNYKIKLTSRTKYGAKLNKFYLNVSKYDLFLKFLIAIIAAVTVVSSIVYDNLGSNETSNPSMTNVSWILYFTHISAFYVMCWYLTYVSFQILNYEKGLKLLDRIPFKGSMVFMITLTGLVFCFALLGPLIYGEIADEWSTSNPILWWVLTTFLHVLIPLLVWVDFRSSEYKEPRRDKISYYFSVWTILITYLVWQLIMVHYTGNAPYPFLNYIKFPLLTAITLPLLTIFSGFLSWYIELKFEKNTFFID